MLLNNASSCIIFIIEVLNGIKCKSKEFTYFF